MAASATVSELHQFRNLVVPRPGVVTLNGYGISVNVNRGHLIVKDGIIATLEAGRFHAPLYPIPASTDESAQRKFVSLQVRGSGLPASPTHL